MRSFIPLLTALSLAALAFPAAAESTTAGDPVVLYGNLLDPATKSFELTPYPPEKEWYSPGVCALPNSFLPAPAEECQLVHFPLSVDTTRDLPLDGGNVKVVFYLSADFILIPVTVTDATGPLPVEDVGVIPAVTAEAILSVDGKVAAQGLVENQNIVTGPGGEPTAFAFDMAPQVDTIPAGAPVVLTVQWWQAEAAGTRTGFTMYNMHEGGDYWTTMEVPTTIPPLEFLLESTSLDLADACRADAPPVAEKHLRKILRDACRLDPRPPEAVLVDVGVAYAFEDPPIQLDELVVSVQGDTGRALTDPTTWTDEGVLHLGYVWDHIADGVDDPAGYTVAVTYDGAPVSDVALSKALGLEAGNALPAPMGPAVIALLGAVALALARRRA